MSDMLIPLSGEHSGFEVRLREVKHTWKHAKLNVSGNFFYLAFSDSNPTIDEFIDYLYHRIYMFCIPKNERDNAEAEYKKTGEARYITDLHDKAKSLFIQKEQLQGKAGEPGELILFTILEATLKAPQIVCKMYLKTSTEMPIHGSDGIHVLPKDDGSMHFYWGESKLVKEVSSALDDVCESIIKFVTPQGGKTPRKRDIEILSDHMTVQDPKLRQAIKDYFDPYKENSNKKVEIFACLVGSECVYDKIKGKKKEEIEEVFIEEYKKRIETACELFEKKIQSKSLESINFHLFLLPFDNLDSFRKKFFTKLGVSK